MSNSDFELPPLPPDITALLAAERGRPGPSPESQTRMLSSICTTLGLPLPAGPGSGPDGGGDGSGPGDASGLDDAGAAGSGAAGTTGLHGLSRAVAAAVKPATLIAFAIGAVTGAGTVVLIKRDHVAPASEVKQNHPRQGNPPVARTTLSPTAASPPSERPKAAPSHDVAPRLVVRSKTSAHSETAGEGDRLAAERNLVEMARAALTRGRPEDALRALEAHRRQFPRGHLAEEREAVWVLALVAKGSLAEAEARATRFTKKHPASLLRAVIEEAVGKAKAAR